MASSGHGKTILKYDALPEKAEEYNKGENDKEINLFPEDEE